MFSYIQSLISNPKEMIIFFLLALPARAMALSVHEWAHARMAYRCGDPTAKMMGRMTLNPAAHLDLLGTIMMAIVGFGWAKPVPVNPRNFRNYRRDDILVSVAGVAMNLILFLASYIVCVIVLLIALSTLPEHKTIFTAGSGMCITSYMGEKVFFSGDGYYMTISDILRNAPLMADYIIAPIWGRMAGYIFEMLQYFVLVNIALAVFNLIPVPPLDGSHVLANVLPRNPYRNPKVGQITYLILLALIFTGTLGELLSHVTTAAMNGVGSLLYALVQLLGLG